MVSSILAILAPSGGAFSAIYTVVYRNLGDTGIVTQVSSNRRYRTTLIGGFAFLGRVLDILCLFCEKLKIFR